MKTKVRITWNGGGGPLCIATVEYDERKNEGALRDALVELIDGQIVSPGDSFTLETVEGAK